jgi:hypothetical protein
MASSCGKGISLSESWYFFNTDRSFFEENAPWMIFQQLQELKKHFHSYFYLIPANLREETAAFTYKQVSGLSFHHMLYYVVCLQSIYSKE